VDVIGLDPDAFEAAIQRAMQELARGFEELNRATADIAARQQALVEAQAELQKMRIESLSRKTQIEAVRKAVVEMATKASLLRGAQIDAKELQKQLESVTKALEDLNPR
jgi:hypothetical protein